MAKNGSIKRSKHVEWFHSDVAERKAEKRKRKMLKQSIRDKEDCIDVSSAYVDLLQRTSNDLNDLLEEQSRFW